MTQFNNAKLSFLLLAVKINRKQPQQPCEPRPCPPPPCGVPQPACAQPPVHPFMAMAKLFMFSFGAMLGMLRGQGLPQGGFPGFGGGFQGFPGLGTQQPAFSGAIGLPYSAINPGPASGFGPFEPTARYIGYNQGAGYILPGNAIFQDRFNYTFG